jgi:hypothetical protein
VVVHCPIDVPPHSRDLDVGLVDEPPVPNLAPARARRVDQFGGEPLDPAEQGDVIDIDAALRQVPVRNADRRYQRTATRITSGGKRNPENANGACTGGLERR